MNANPFELALGQMASSGQIAEAYRPDRGTCLPVPNKGGGRGYFFRLSFKALDVPALQAIGHQFQAGTVLAGAITPEGLPTAPMVYNPASRDKTRIEAAHKSRHGHVASGRTFADRVMTAKWNPKWHNVTMGALLPALQERGYECCAAFSQAVLPRPGAQQNPEDMAKMIVKCAPGAEKTVTDAMIPQIERAFREGRALEDLPTRWIRLCFVEASNKEALLGAAAYLEEEVGLGLGDGNEYLSHFEGVLKARFGEVFGHWNLKSAGADRDEISVVVTPKPINQREKTNNLVFRDGFLRPEL